MFWEDFKQFDVKKVLRTALTDFVGHLNFLNGLRDIQSFSKITNSDIPGRAIYRVTLADGIEPKRRLLGSDAIVPEDPDMDNFEMQTVQLVSALEEGSMQVDATNNELYMLDVVRNTSKKMAKGSDKEGALQIAEQEEALLFNPTNIAPTMDWTDFEQAVLGFQDRDIEENLHILLSNTSAQKALGLDEIAALNYNQDSIGKFKTGEIEGTVLGMNVMRSTSTHKNYEDTIVATSITINASITTISLTAVTPDRTVRKLKIRQVIKCEDEYMLITDVNYTGDALVTLEVVRGYWGSTAAGHTGPIGFALVVSYLNMAYTKDRVAKLFIPQKPGTRGGAVKETVTTPDGKFSMSVLEENIPGFGGKTLTSFMIDLAVKAIPVNAADSKAGEVNSVIWIPKAM